MKALDFYSFQDLIEQFAFFVSLVETHSRDNNIKRDM